MAIYRCEVCDYIYDEDKESVKWADLPDDWVCPVCESEKSEFVSVEEDAGKKANSETVSEDHSDINEFIRKSDDLEVNMADIHKIANSGESIIEAMRSKKPTFSWDDILVKGAQLAKIPLNHEEPVNTQTIIGPGAKQPLIIESPIFVTHMSFGALSQEAKLALWQKEVLPLKRQCVPVKAVSYLNQWRMHINTFLNMFLINIASQKII